MPTRSGSPSFPSSQLDGPAGVALSANQTEMVVTSEVNDSFGQVTFDTQLPEIQFEDGAAYDRGEPAPPDFFCTDDGTLAYECTAVIDVPGPGPNIELNSQEPFLPTDLVGTYAVTSDNVDIWGNAVSAQWSYTVADVICAGRAADVLTSIGEVPTQGADVISATDGGEIVHGLGGNDVICAQGGGDVVIGGAGNDRILAGDGNDLVTGDAGNDVISGGNQNDRVLADAGNDNLTGNAGNDLLEGSSGSDRIDGGSGGNTCHGQEGANDRQTGCEVRTGFP